MARPDSNVPISVRLEREIVRIPDNGCWIWSGAQTQHGYGVIRFLGMPVYVHRLMYEIHKGSVAERFEVCHRCDNPSCCNPHHLFLGTRQDNMQDMWSKGRRRITNMPRGENHPHAKFTETLVRDVRRLHATGASRSHIAEKFGLGTNQIKMLVAKHGGCWRNWKEVNP